MNNMTLSKPVPALLGRIAITGIIAGVLDAVGAMVVFQAKFKPLFKFIASGVFGPSAFSSGDSMAWYGIAFHFIIALSWTLLYFVASPYLKLQRINSILMMLIYGIFIWLVMNLIVLPFTQVPQRPFQLVPALEGIAILIVAVALPIVISAKLFYRATN
jgi:hypothetical protein